MPIIRDIMHRPEWARASRRVMLGSSIGAWNTLLCAAGRHDDAEAMWRSIRGIDDVLAVRLDPWNGLRSMRPALGMLKAAEAGKGLTLDAYAATVDIAQKRHVLLHLNSLGRADKHTAVECSGSQPLIMTNVDFRDKGYFDGGAGGHIMPHLESVVRPAGSNLPPKVEEFSEIHAIFCSPLPGHRKVERTQDDICTAVARAKVALEMLIDAAVAYNVTQLQDYADRGVSVTVYAPESWDMCGAPDDFGSATVENRLGPVAAWMLANPTVLAPA